MMSLFLPRNRHHFHRGPNRPTGDASRFHPTGRQFIRTANIRPTHSCNAVVAFPCSYPCTPIYVAARHDAPHSLDVHDFFERLPELRVEDGVDDRVDEAVHVPEPGRQDEGRHARLAGHVQLGTHRVHDVAGEERHPAD